MIYERRASPLHAARAAVAAGWALALIVTAVLSLHPLVLGALLAITLAGAGMAHVGARVALMLRFAIAFGVVIALINLLVARQGLTVLWRMGEVPPFGQMDLTLEALVYGLLLALRAVVVLAAAALLSATVDPDELLRMFRRVSFRSALTAALAVRLVPVLGRDARRMAEARRCRLDQPGRVAVLKAVTAGALDRAVDVAATLEVRGYKTAVPGSAAAREPWSRHDVAFAASAAGVLVLAAGARLLGIAGVEAYPATVIELGPPELVLCAALALVALLPFAARRGIAR